MKFLEFYRQRIPNLPEPNSKGECVVVCIFHSDKNPSLAVNIDSGKFKCYTPSCRAHRGGGYKMFEKLLTGDAVGNDFAIAPIDENTIVGFSKVLENSPTPLDILHHKRGLNKETIARFRLGWDGDRILIPIKAQDGKYLNVRKYKYGAVKDKVIAWATGYNVARLFPIDSLQSDQILLCEGEMDAMLACQLGFAGITSTNGADTWPEAFSTLFSGKRVTVCYDVDKSGRMGAGAVATKLASAGATVHVLTLPLRGTKEEKDLTDYVVKLGHTAADLQALIDAAPEFKGVEERAAPSDEVTELHLSLVGQEQYVGKRIASTVLIAGKDLAPFQVPSKINYTCPSMGSEKLCDRCGICAANGKKEVQVPDWSPDLLQMVNVPVEKLNALLGRLAGVPERCPKFKMEVEKYANVEAIKAIPEIDFAAEHAEYVIRNLFYLGHGIETNHTYAIKAVVMPEPKTQYATALIYEALPARDTIEKFALTQEVVKALSVFQVSPQ